MKLDFIPQISKYFFVSLIAFAIDISLLYVLTDYLGIFYLASATFSFIAGLITNYLLAVYFVFKNRNYSNRYLEFSIYALIGLVGLGINDLFIYIFTDVLDFYYIYSKLMITVFVFLWNFLARKYILFNKTISENE